MFAQTRSAWPSLLEGETRSTRQRLGFWLVAIILAVLIYTIFISHPGINGYSKAIFPDMIYGRAYKPYVYRVLLPVIVRLITSALPAEMRAALNQWLGAKHTIQKLGWEQEYLTEYVLASLLMIASLIGFAFALRYLFKGVLSATSKFIDLVCLLALMGLPPFFKYYSYVYDFPALFLFTLGLGLMARQRWPAFLSVFFLACLNKETAILLTLVFALNFFNPKLIDRALCRRLLSIQFTIFGAVKLGLFVIFRNNAGEFVEYFHLLDHNFIWLLLEPYSMSNLLAGLVLVVLIFYKWQEKPDFLKRALWIAVPLAVLTLFLGFLDELRDYYEIYPIAVLLLSQTSADLIGLRIKNIWNDHGEVSDVG